MKLFYICIFLLILCFTSQSLEAQVIHQKDVEKFIGVVKTTPLNKPDTWPDDSTFTSNRPLENSFLEYSLNSTQREMGKKYPHDWNSNETYSLAIWPNSRNAVSLKIDEKSFSLIMLHNGGFEGSTSFLTLWRHVGDSLQFRHLFSTPFYAGLGLVQFEPNYIIDVYNNPIFVIKASGGDAGWVGGYYQFLELDRRNNLTSLLKIEFDSDYGFENHVLYKFLDKNNLLVAKYNFSTTQVRDQFDGRNFRLNERKLVKSEFELLDLIELVNTAKNQN